MQFSLFFLVQRLKMHIKAELKALFRQTWQLLCSKIHFFQSLVLLSQLLASSKAAHTAQS